MQDSTQKKKKIDLRFDAGRVFSPTDAKAEDFKLDLDAARYKARKGQAGTRYGGGGYCANCGLSLSACTCGRLGGTRTTTGRPVMNRSRTALKD